MQTLEKHKSGTMNSLILTMKFSHFSMYSVEEFWKPAEWKSFNRKNLTSWEIDNKNFRSKKRPKDKKLDKCTSNKANSKWKMYSFIEIQGSQNLSIQKR